MTLSHRFGRACHVLVLVLCLSAAEDFDWSANNHDSFYYGTFPNGMIPPIPYRSLFLSHKALWEINRFAWISIIQVKQVNRLMRLQIRLNVEECLRLFRFICQDFRGEPAVQPIRQKEPGTKMGKD